MAKPERKGVWLDCDPGHDDAFALILAGHHPALRLIGVSTTHGNSPVSNTTTNALQILHAAGLGHVPVIAGAAKPLVRSARACPDIHGDSGLDTVEGGTPLPPLPMEDGHARPSALLEGKAVNFMHASLQGWYKQRGHKAVLIATGPLTNVALLLSVYPEVRDVLDSIVLMGGAVGMGNTRPSSEFNIELDPEAAHIVFTSGVPVVMVPLEVTHTALATPAVLDRVAHGGTRLSPQDCAMPSLHAPGEAVLADEAAAVAAGAGLDTSIRTPGQASALEEAEQARAAAAAASGAEGPALPTDSGAGGAVPGSTPFRRLCGSLLRYFASSYRSVFLMAAPPLHDPCAVYFVISAVVGAGAGRAPTVAHIGGQALAGLATPAAVGDAPASAPVLSSPLAPAPAFTSSLCRVDVELSSPLSYGRTIVDLYHVRHGIGGYTPSARAAGKYDDANVRVCLAMDVPGFWAAMLEAVAAADAHSPMNAPQPGVGQDYRAVALALWQAAQGERTGVAVSSGASATGAGAASVASPAASPVKASAGGNAHSYSFGAAASPARLYPPGGLGLGQGIALSPGRLGGDAQPTLAGAAAAGSGGGADSDGPGASSLGSSLSTGAGALSARGGSPASKLLVPRPLAVPAAAGPAGAEGV